MFVFLFTDIEGSSKLWEEHTEVMTPIIARHDQILRQQVDAAGGRITKHTGDGITAVFDGGQPLACALEAQKHFAEESWGEIGEMRIRAGLHAGEAEFHLSAGTADGDYFGPPVNATARVMSAAWGGQVLLTPEVTQASPLPTQATLLDLGEHLLKNVSVPQQLYQLVHPQLPHQEFPPPRTLSGHSIRRAIGERGVQVAMLEPEAMGIALVTATLLPIFQGELEPESGALEGNLGVLDDLGALSLRQFTAQLADNLRAGQPAGLAETEALLRRALMAQWQAGGEMAVALRADASRLLQAVHGVEAAMAAATDEVKEALAHGLAGLGEQFDEFRWMLAGVRDTLAEIQARQALQLALQREQLGLQQRQLARTEELLQRQKDVERPALEIDVSPAHPAFLEAEAQEIGRPVFVARERELARLEGFLETALTGQGRVVFVTGGPGRGKTALLSEFARQAMETHADLLVASGYCNAYSGVGDPYLPFRDVLGMLAGDVEARWAAGAISRDHALRLWGALPLAIQALVDHGPHVVPALVPGPALLSRAKAVAPAGAPWLQRLQELVERGPAHSEGLEQSHLFQQITHVLRALAEAHPLLLILDDLQWVDTASAGLLFHLGRRLEGSRILVAGTYRPEEVALGREGEPHRLEKVLAEFKRSFGDVWLDLTEVQAPEGRHFVDALLETEPNRLGEGFRRALFEHTGGHPLFTVELLRTMQERGDLVQDGTGRWVPAAALDWERLPARVEGVIEARIGRLEGELRDLLSVASVEGEEFTAQVVARVQELGQRQALRRLSQELEKRHRLVREQSALRLGRQRLSRYRFAHALFQQYLYNHLGDGERALLHGEVAAVLEELYQGCPEEVAAIAPQLARHFTEAGDEEHALRYLIMAGDGALAAFANAEAERHFRTALDLVEAETDRAHLLSELGIVQARLSRYEEAIETWREGIELYSTLGDGDGVAHLYTRAGRAAWHGGDHRRSLALCREGMAALAAATEGPQLPETPEVADLLHETANACHFSGLPDEAASLCYQSLEMARRLGAVKVQAEALGTLGMLPGLPPEEAVSAFTQAVDLAESAGLLRQAARAHNNLGVILAVNIGDFQAARDQFIRAADLDRRRGCVAEELFAATNATGMALYLGALSAAEKELSSLRPLLDAAHVPGTAAILFGSTEALLLRFRGEPGQAVEKLRPLQAEARETGDLQSLAGIDQTLAEALLELGEEGQAKVALQEAIILGDCGLRPYGGVLPRCVLSVVCSRQGAIAEARSLISEAREKAAGLGDIAWNAVWLLSAEAHLAAAESNWSAAWGAFADTADGWARMGMRWYRARTLQEWAEAHLSRGEPGDRGRARELLREAEAEFEAMGAPGYTSQIRARLHQVDAG